MPRIAHSLCLRKPRLLLSLTAILLCISAFSQTTSAGANQSSPDALIGLWGVEQVLAPTVGGELTIDGRGAQWRASIAGLDAPVEHKQNAVGFSLPGKQGEFRGRPLGREQRIIIGQWIQPGSTYPYNQRYATPVELSEIQPNVWRGSLVPLEPRVAFYVSIQRGPDGALTAFIRNPEANLFRRRSYTVKREGKSVVFSRQGDEFQGTYDEKTATLTLPLLDGRPAMQLTRRERDGAPGFYARAVPSGYTYAKPITTGDGWQTASLENVGIDLHPITAMIEKIMASDRSSDTLNIHSFLIARHGKLVLEEYFYGFSQDRPHDMRSASKTFAPVLVGIARQGGAKIGPETPIYSLFPEYKPFPNWDERKSRLTLRDLMTMTPGLACEDGKDSSPGDEDTMQSQTAQPDWYKYTLDLPMVREPGGNQAIYCSASTNLVGGVVRNATSKWLPELFYEGFARPLQMQSYYINLMPTGEAYSGGGLYMRARDQLKLGQLYLAGGVWNGRRVVSDAWVKESVARRATFPETKIDPNHGYGYAWHVRELKVGDRVFHDYFAGGNGGQNVIVIPELDMVIGFTGGSYGEFNKFFRWERELVPQYIIPAALGPTGSQSGSWKPKQPPDKQ